MPVFSDGPNGSVTPSSQLDLARVIIQAVKNGADIINISGGQLKPSAEAADWLDKAYKQRDSWLSFLKIDPIWDCCRGEAPLETMLAKIGLAD